MKPVTFGIVGGGWRSEFFLRIATALPDRFRVAGMAVRREERARQLEQQFGVTTVRTHEQLLDKLAADNALDESGFVVTSIPRDVNPGIMLDLCNRGVPVLSETPPATDIDAMNRLYEQVGEAGGRVQVAEQYHLQPLHAARLALCASGALGPVSQAQISAAHGYHGISLMRRALGIAAENAAVRGMGFSSKNVQGATRTGPPAEEKVADAWQEIFSFDFGDRLGIYDFNYEQYFAYVRNERVCIRGERGEIINKQVTTLADAATPVVDTFVRHDAGAEGNLEGYHHKGIQLGGQWLFRSPYAGAAMSDDEIAIAGCLDAMAHYARTGEAFYSLAEASQDHYLALIGAQAAEQGKVIETSDQVWSSHVAPPHHVASIA